MKSLAKLLLIFGLIINPIVLCAQSDSLKINKKANPYIGIDAFNPVYGLFTDKKGIEGLITYPITHKIHIALEGGYEENIYDYNNWLASASGPYVRLGGQYFVSQDDKNPNMGYYVGARLGYSKYKQTVDSFIILGNNGDNETSSLPEHDASAFWVEPLAGGRVQVLQSPFYIDASVRLKIRASASNDYGIDPLIIPGFGTDQSSLAIGVNWSIGYALPF
ncbi:MAG: DUF6048 family protein [Weeksellaceae bacterium]